MLIDTIIRKPNDLIVGRGGETKQESQNQKRLYMTEGALP
jgi:hypothetical protein